GVDERRVVRQVREQAELDLGVIGGDQPPAWRRYEGGADATSLLAAHRDVLQVRVRARQPAGGGDGLVEGGVHPSGPGVDQRRQRVHVRRLELGEGAELEDLRRQRMLAREARQHVYVGRQPGLPPPNAADRDLQALEEHFAEL